MSEKICGVIGGVGPSATADFYKLVIAHTPATKDQEHLRVLIDSHPQIPDRTKAILEGGETPMQHMLESAQLLQKAGADFLVCPCNTAHYFFEELQAKIDIPLVSMIEETAKYLQKNNINKAGLLSTSGTAKSGIYQNILGRFGIDVFIPEESGIKAEMEAIYGEQGIKAGVQYEKTEQNKKLFKLAIDQMRAHNIDGVIMGCTEIPLCLEASDCDLQLINPTAVLAQAVVDRCRVITA